MSKGNRPSKVITNTIPQKQDVKQKPEVKTLTPQTNNQKLLLHALQHLDMIIAHGYPGTGKTYVTTTYAAQLLLNGKIEKLVVMRPPEPMGGRTVGFLKGGERDKLTPWMAQIIDYIVDVIGKELFDEYLEEGKIVLQLMETVRGRSFKNSFIIIDESQLVTPKEMQAITTRLGQNSTMVFCGDTKQTEIKSGKDGLSYLIEIMKTYNLTQTGVVKFEIADCVRHGLVKELTIAYEQEGWL